MDDEEDAGMDQDDLYENTERRNRNAHELSPTGALRKRYFYQMNFELEFPYSNDTVYLAYSQPYPYT